jgi:purine-binding chemotaxis protein CheW
VPDNVTVTTGTSLQRPDSPDPDWAGASSPHRFQQGLVVFEVGGEVAAFPIQNVERITPMALLGHPPGLPSALEGILNLEGIAVPVLRLDRLLQLKEQRPGLYSMLIVMKGVADGPTALLVDRVSRVVTVAESAVLPVGKQNSFNDCASGVVTVDDQVIHLLSPARVLMAKELKALSEFQETAQRRLRDWGLREP